MNLKDINLEELNDMTLVQLKELAKELDIKSISKYKKNELIDLIKNYKDKDWDAYRNHRIGFVF